jgi:hypothetical protein
VRDQVSHPYKTAGRIMGMGNVLWKCLPPQTSISYSVIFGF